MPEKYTIFHLYISISLINHMWGIWDLRFSWQCPFRLCSSGLLSCKVLWMCTNVLEDHAMMLMGYVGLGRRVSHKAQENWRTRPIEVGGEIEPSLSQQKQGTGSSPIQGWNRGWPRQKDVHVLFLERGFFSSFGVRTRGFNVLLRQNPSSPFMLLG